MGGKIGAHGNGLGGNGRMRTSLVPPSIGVKAKGPGHPLQTSPRFSHTFTNIDYFPVRMPGVPLVKAIVDILFTVLNVLNWLGSLLALLPLVGMMTNANGFLSGGFFDYVLLTFFLSLPVCAATSTFIYKKLEKHTTGLAIAAIPAFIALLIMSAG